MGDVYRARDTRLGRTVAIKVLPPEVASDPERRHRFEVEARAASALDHPNICALYDVGEQVPAGPAIGPPGAPPLAAAHFLVMEYLDGETLADRLARGPLPLQYAMQIGVEVAEALAAAHGLGVVHRDLKPANVMLTRKGVGGHGAPSAKLLDFGLARLTQGGLSEVRDDAVTDPSVPMGTVPYMAPEQLEGRPPDARTDVFAFGAVLYEMLTGRRAFQGGSPAGVIAAILEHDPLPATLPEPSIPPALQRVLRRCLAKDPADRWQSASDLADELRWLGDKPDAGTNGAGVVAVVRSSPWRYLRLAAAALLLVASGAALTWFVRSTAKSAAVAGLSLDLSPARIGRTAQSFTPGGSSTAIAWAGDGRTLVFSGDRGEVRRLYLRNLDDAVARPLEGTDGAYAPAVSPDGKWVAFWAARTIRKMPLGGGPSAVLASNLPIPAGMAWDEAGNLYFGGEDDRISVVAASTARRPVTTVGDGEERHLLPWPLPGGKALLFTVRKSGYLWGNEEVVALTLATGQRKRVLSGAADARYLPSGHLVFLRRGTLMAVAFDPGRLEVRGRPEVMLDAVAQALTGSISTVNTGAGQFAIGPDGTLAWIRSPVVEYPDGALVRVDRRGQVTRLPAEARPYGPVVRVSPDGRRLAVTVITSTTGGLWVYNLARRLLTPVHVSGLTTSSTWWSRDGRRLVFNWNPGGRHSLAWASADGSGTLQVLVRGQLMPSSSTGDGKLAVVRLDDAAGDEVLLATEEDGQTRLAPLLASAENSRGPAFSPDGRWLAYSSSLTGRREVYVRPFPGPGAGERVSVDGGCGPAWNPNGRELFFYSTPDQEGRGVLMAVSVTPGDPLKLGPPTRLFEFDNSKGRFACNPVRCYDVAPDGQSFYAVQTAAMPAPAPVTHVNIAPNWVDELKVRVPTG
jgi:serine/threonine-protein kinase